MTFRGNGVQTHQDQMANSGTKLRILGVAVHTVDHFAGLPLWKYSMSFAYLKAYLSQFHEYADISFEMYNYYQNESIDQIVDQVLAADPHLVLFSVYVWNYNIYAHLARRIKEVNPHIMIVLGGPEVAEDTQVILHANPDFDVIVRGEGEHVFYELVRRCLANASFADVLGITYRDHDQIHRNPNQDQSILAQLDVIPSVFSPDILTADRLTGSFAALETQRGCNFSCGFCRYRQIGQGARFFSLERVKQELEFLKDVGIKHLYLMDPTFNNKIERAKTILRHIINLDMNVTINAEMVPEFMDTELLELALEAGMNNLEVGVQSIHKEALKVMQRPRNSKKLQPLIETAARIKVKDKKLNVIPQVIYGLPGETFEHYCQSFDFVYDLSVDEIGAYHLLVLRDTQFYRDKETHGFIYEEDPPHRLISSSSFSKDDIVLAGKMSCVATSTQYYLRPFIKDYVRRHGLTASTFFLCEVGLAAMDDELAYSFPIYTLKHADLLGHCLQRIGEVLLLDAPSIELEEAILENETLFEVRALHIEASHANLVRRTR